MSASDAVQITSRLPPRPQKTDTDGRCPHRGEDGVCNASRGRRREPFPCTGYNYGGCDIYLRLRAGKPIG